jgi:hypothetical protein
MGAVCNYGTKSADKYETVFNDNNNIPEGFIVIRKKNVNIYNYI